VKVKTTPIHYACSVLEVPRNEEYLFCLQFCISDRKCLSETFKEAQFVFLCHGFLLKFLNVEEPLRHTRGKCTTWKSFIKCNKTRACKVCRNQFFLHLTYWNIDASYSLRHLKKWESFILHRNPCSSLKLTGTKRLSRKTKAMYV
jgi:hypothetical protein